MACFSFPFRMFLRVPTVLRIGSPFASSVLVGSHLYAHSCCQCLTLSPQTRFLVVLAGVECLRMFLALSSVLPFPLLWFLVRLHSNCSRTWLVLGALQLPARFLAVLHTAVSLHVFWSLSWVLPFQGSAPVSRLFLSLRTRRSRSHIPSLAPSSWSPSPLLRWALLTHSCYVLCVTSASS